MWPEDGEEPLNAQEWFVARAREHGRGRGRARLMRVYFLRHGKAEDRAAWQGRDADRPLTAEGEEALRREAKQLRAVDLALDVIVTSPLARARRTAEIVADELGLAGRLVEDDRLAPGVRPRAAWSRCWRRTAPRRRGHGGRARARLQRDHRRAHRRRRRGDEEGRARARRRDRARSRRRTAGVAAHAASPGEQMKMEVEAKFLVPDEETLARLVETASLAGCAVEPGEPRRDVDTFLDTPDRRLLAAGYYFRRRETGDGVRLTLKQLVAPSEGMLRREEIEALVAADVPVAEWPAGELRTRVEQLTGGEPLEAMLTLSQVRVARVVRRGRKEIAELSLDRVTASAPDGDRGWLEAEVEARGRGVDGDVAALAAVLRDEWGLVPEGRAKFTRALELAGDEDDGVLMAAAERAVHEAQASGDGRSRAPRAGAARARPRPLAGRGRPRGRPLRPAGALLAGALPRRRAPASTTTRPSTRARERGRRSRGGDRRSGPTSCPRTR